MLVEYNIRTGVRLEVQPATNDGLNDRISEKARSTYCLRQAVRSISVALSPHSPVFLHLQLGERESTEMITHDRITVFQTREL